MGEWKRRGQRLIKNVVDIYVSGSFAVYVQNLCVAWVIAKCRYHSLLTTIINFILIKKIVINKR